ncbi:MAG: LEPR-XLL domain-containing protein [Pseudomonadota bacterium]
MAVSLTDLFPLRSARSSATALGSHPLYRKHGRARAAARPSKIGFETFEPRVLLSADTGIDTGVTVGLAAIGAELSQLLTADDTSISTEMFDSFVPGILISQGSGADRVEISPTFRQVMSIEVDIDHDGKIPTQLSAYVPAANDLDNRFEYVRDTPNFFASAEQKTEAALRAMDLNSDGRVSLDEAFKVIVVGQIESYLQDNPIGGGSSSDNQDAADTLADFLDGGLLVGLGVPSNVDDLVTLDVGIVVGDYDADTHTLSWAMHDLAFGLTEIDTFDLGYQGDQLGILLDPDAATEADRTQIAVNRTLTFSNFTFGFRGAGDSGDAVANADFFFATPGGVTLAVAADSTGNDIDAAFATVNVGFLGTTVTSSSMTLDMAALGTAIDPSSAVAFGFTGAQLGALQSGGVITAANTPDATRLGAADIEFTIKIGTAPLMVPIKLTVDTSPSNTSIADLVTAVNSAIAGNAALDAILQASDAGGKLRIALTDTDNDVTQLGFLAQQGGLATTLTAGSASSLIGAAAPGTPLTFLLGRGGAVPKLVSVTVTNDPLGPDGLSGDAAKDADNNTVSLASLKANLQSALNAAFGAGAVTVGDNGSGRLTLNGNAQVLEITHSLTVDTVEQITLAELQGPAQSFELAADANASYVAELNLTAKDGLELSGSATAYAPTGTISVDVKPFTSDIVGKKLDDGTNNFKASYTLTDGTANADNNLNSGTSEMQPMLDWNVIGPADILGTINQIGNWAERLAGTDLLQAFDLPFADVTLGDLLNFKDVIADTLLLDDGDDGATKPGTTGVADVQRLLKWALVNGQQQLIARFATAQQLEITLAKVLHELGLMATEAAALAQIDASVLQYTEDGFDKQDFVVRLEIKENLLPQVGGVDTPVSVPLDFQFDDLAPLANFETSGKLKITAEGEFGFTLGIKLGNAVAALTNSSNLLDDLNSGQGIKVNDNLAVTSLGAIDPIIGRLSGNAEFTVTVFTGPATSHSYTVTLNQGLTLDNKTVAQLKADLVTAIGSAVKVNAASPALSTFITAANEAANTDQTSARLVLRAISGAVVGFQIDSANAVTRDELGFQPARAATVSLVAPIGIATPDPSGPDLVFNLKIARNGAPAQDVDVTLAAAATDGNVAIDSLITDLNAALATALGANQLLASQSGGVLVISAVASNIIGFKLTPISGANASIGLSLTAYQATLTNASVAAGDQPDGLVAGVSLRAGASPLDPFGRLGVAVNFTINGTLLSLATADAAQNVSVDDLVRLINDKIDGSALDGKIVALNLAGRVGFTALDQNVAAITIAGFASDAQAAALGLRNGDTTFNAAPAVPDLAITATRLAPVSYGVSSDAAFTLTVNGVDRPITLAAIDTIQMRSVYDLAGALNGALNTAFGGVKSNPLIATVQAGQLVIGLRTAATGTNLIGNQYLGTLADPIALVNTFGVSAVGTNSAATELKLVKALAGTQVQAANHGDLMVISSSGGEARIRLDNAAIAGVTVDANNKLAGNLGALLAGIQSQLDTAFGVNKIKIYVGADGTSLRLDEADPLGSGELRVQALNGSPAAIQLGLLGKDTSNLNLGEAPATVGVRDGLIEGARIATIDLLDRVYLDDAGLTATLQVVADAVTAEATLGFVGITLSTDANQVLFDGTVTIGLFDAANNKRTLADLFDALGSVDDLDELVSVPQLTVTSNLNFNIAVTPAITDVISSLGGATPKLGLAFEDADDDGISDAITLEKIVTPPSAALPNGAVDYRLVVPAITVTGLDALGDLANFDGITFKQVVAALQGIADFLKGFEAFDFLDEEIPGLGLSVNDLIDVADKFAAAVDAMEDDPSGGLQKLEQQILEAFGLPDLALPADLNAFFTTLGIPNPTKLVRFALDSTTVGANDILVFDLRLPVGFSKGMKVDFDLGDVEFLGQTLPIDLQGGAGLATNGYLDARLKFGVDLNDPTKVYVYNDATGVLGHLGANANNLSFNAAIGPMGVYVKDGNLQLALDFAWQDDDGAADNSRVLLGDFVANLPSPELTGIVKATLPVYFPDDSSYLGDIGLDMSGANAITLNANDGLSIPNLTDVLTLPDFSNIDLTALNPFDSIPLMLDSLDFFLQGLQDIMEGEVFGIELPFIGDQLQGGADFIEDLRRDVLGPIRQFVEQAPQLGEQIVQALLYELLADGTAQGQVEIDGVMVNVEDIIGLPGDIQGIGLLRPYAGGNGTPLQADIQLNPDAEAQNDYRWLFRLGGSADPTIPLDFDLGIPGLSFDIYGGLDVTLDWDLALGLGLSLEDGAYIWIGDQRATGATDDAELSLTLDVALQANTGLKGELGFLQLTMENSTLDPQGDLEGDGTHLTGSFSVDLRNSADGADSKLSFSELGSIDAVVEISAEAEVNLKITAEFSESIVPASIAAVLPKLEGRFVLDWEAIDVLGNDFDFGESLQFVGFRDVGLDMGSFINDFLGPFVEKVAEVTEPLQPIIDVITAPIPVLSDLAGQPVTLVDIAGMTGYVEPAMIYAIADIISFVNRIADASQFGSLLLPIGDFVLLDKGAAGDYLSGATLMTAGYNVAGDSKFDKANLSGFLGSTVGALDDFATLLGAADTGGDASKAKTKELVGSLAGGGEAVSSGFSFPLFDNPALAFGLLMGKDIPLVEYDLAPFGMEFTYVQKFPIWGPLFARISGSAGLTIDLAFGYDTAGVREFADGGFSNPLDLLGGLYVNDTDGPGGTGTDVPELILKGEIFAGAEINLGVASAGVEGGIILTVNFDLYDPDGDGKVRVDELLGNFLYEFNYGTPALAPLAIFDVFGDVSAQLRAFIEALFIKKTFEITPPITLVEFSVPFEREPFLATERNDGSLLLNIGPNAQQRLNGDTRDIDEEIYVESVSDSEVRVWGMGIAKSDAQTYKIGANKLIVGYGGAGNDLIDLQLVTHNIAYEIEGGIGDDEIFGTQAGGSMRGDTGNDKLTGGLLIDLIFGGEGNDTIDGMAGRDRIFGDTGVISGSKFRSFVGEKDGDDKINGGDGEDIVFGGGGNDVIKGDDDVDAGDSPDLIFGDGGSIVLLGDPDTDSLADILPRINGRLDVSVLGAGGKDTIFGNGGRDFIIAGAGDDFVDGGDGNDEIELGVGFDVGYGGGGADTVYGGENDDVIFGGRDPYGDADFGQAGDTGDAEVDGDDRLEGEAGNDLIRGNDGADTILGQRGADILFGDIGNDIITGEAGGDIVFGGAGDDTIDAGDGADIVFGDDGLVVYFGFPDADVGANPVDHLGSRLRHDAAGNRLIGDGAVDYTYAGHDAIGTSMDLIVTQPIASDGSDTISGGDGDDIVFGGGSGPSADTSFDTIFGDFDPATTPAGPRPSGQDTLIGDGGRIELLGRRMAYAAAISDAGDGRDRIAGNDAGDYIFGGGERDIIDGFQQAAGRDPLASVPDNDIILGDNGEIRFDPTEVANRITRINTTYVAGDSGKSDEIRGNAGNDVVFGGLNSSSDIIDGDAGQDVLVGDQGQIRFDLDGDLDTLDLIESFTDGVGGVDIVSGNAGDDVIIGGTAGDILKGNDGLDVMLGDNGRIELVGGVGALLVRIGAMPPNGTAIDLIVTTDGDGSSGTLFTYTGGDDTIEGHGGGDILFGGVNDDGIADGDDHDLLFGDQAVGASVEADGDDILVGDNGSIDFTYLLDTDRLTLDIVHSEVDGYGGVDRISGNKGGDIALGGTAGDLMFGDAATGAAAGADGRDIMLGDNGDVLFIATTADLVVPVSGSDRFTFLGGAVTTVVTTDTATTTGGIDTMSGNAGGDIMLGGVLGDFMYGDLAVVTAATNLLDGNDIMLGDSGRVEWRAPFDDEATVLATANLAVNNPLLNAAVNGSGDADLDTIDLITTTIRVAGDPGGRDEMYGDNGSDIVFGGTDSDLIRGENGGAENAPANGAVGNNDILFGDHGRLYAQFSALTGFNSRNFFAIDTGAAAFGQGDRIFGDEGHDVLLGQQGDDRMWGGGGDDDMIGGHNVAGGVDELPPAGVISAQLMTPDNLMNDLMDGEAGTDAMAGDNAVIWRRGDDLSPRFRALVDINGDGLTTDTPIYSATESAIVANIGAAMQSDPDDSVGRDIELLDHSDTVQSDPQGRFGQDVMAGGAGNDTMFGQLGDDLMQGDGWIGADDANPVSITRRIEVTDTAGPTAQMLFFNVPEQASDGDDYMEGNGGRDLMYGGLGQDDMIGGSSALFGLDAEIERPDDADTMFGGAGIDTARNDLGDAVLNTVAKADGSKNYIETIATGHARDADYMMGDNANVFRLVVGGASGTNALDAKDKFLTFNYDNYDTSATPLRIVPRAMQQLDYTLGGADYSTDTTDFYNVDGARQPVGGPADNGAADLIHGESGDDIIFGMTGSDVLFGDGQDDDVIGGYGNDWISGGTGQDGVLGDDGLIFTSRNSSVFGEALYAVEKLLASDPDTRYSNGNVVDELISTPGSLQTATINRVNELKKTVDLVPFSYDRGWIGQDDEFADNAGNTPFADDIIFGGLGSDFLHGGSGDDAISGAEALTAAFVPVYDLAGTEVGVFDLGYSAVGIANALVVNPTHQNPGNVLAFNPEDTDGQHLNNRFRAGEFRLYDEYDPRRKILLNDNGLLNKDDTGLTGKAFLLNFEKADGVFRAAGNLPKATGQQTESYAAVNDDGADAIFGDLGNDWIVGGTGQDHVYGGWGNDMLQVDDNLDTNTADVAGLFDNESPDTHPYYEDRAYGGAGRDILIGNTGGDRLIDWVGEYNSYLVPYAPFGQASVSRTLQPFLPEFLYAQAKADGADPTRLASSADTRNGEPRAELGLVLQKDFAWGDQTGAPADPQAGNIPGGKRDVLRSADFTGNTAQGFVAESGTWSVAGERYEVAPLATSTNKDAISLFDSDVTVPSYFEITAIINAVKPVGGFKANAYVIFDYHSPTDFKFAGIDISTNKIQIGQRASWGFQVLASANMALKAGQDYSVLLAVNGTAVQMVVNGVQSVSYAFQPRRDADGFAYNINAGMYGLGADNAKARIDNVVVQQIPPKITLTAIDTFDTGSSTLLTRYSGNWSFAGGRYDGAPAAGASFAVAANDIAASTSSLLKVDAVFTTTVSGGVVFDVYSPTDFKWAAVSKATNQVLIGHYTAQRGWVTDAAVSRTIGAGDQTLSVTLKGTTASVSLNGLAVLSRIYNAPVVDGGVGTFTHGGTSSFNQFTIQSDDPKFAGTALTSTSTATATAVPQQQAIDGGATVTSFKVASDTEIGTTATVKSVASDDSPEALAPLAVSSEPTAAPRQSSSLAVTEPTIDWSQQIALVDVVAATNRDTTQDDADKSPVWQEDFVVNLGKMARNPNAALRFTI